MSEFYDVIIIGGGVLGCFTARNLCRWKLNICLLEAEPEICGGITRANAAVVYAGYDNKPGSEKATFAAAANAEMTELCAQLDVPFSRPGGLMIAVGPKGEAVLQRKLEQGFAKQVPGIRLLSGAEAREMEPMLASNITAALWAPTTGTVNPMLLGIAAYENALHNGCTAKMNSPVRAIHRDGTGYVLETDSETLHCRMVLNCAGLYADQVQAMIYPGRVSLHWDASDFLVLDAFAEAPQHILFQETENGKGITAVPTTEGNLLLSSPARPLTVPFATTREGLQRLQGMAKELLPELDLQETICSFAGVRPNAVDSQGRRFHSFVIDDPAPDFLSLIGIKTPGLTCANQLGRHLAQRTAEYLQLQPNPEYDPIRRAIVPHDWDIVCQCRRITRGQIEEAIRRGAATVDGVKRRLGTGMGICQGSRCQLEIEKIIACAHNGQLEKIAKENFNTMLNYK